MTAFKDWLNGLTSKTTPVDADEVYVRDSSGTPSSKKLTWANLKATLADTFLSLTGGTITNTASAGSGSLAGSALTVNQTWNTTGTPTAIKINVTDTASNAASLLMDLQVGGASKFLAKKDGALTLAESVAHIGSGVNPAKLVFVPGFGPGTGLRIGSYNYPATVGAEVNAAFYYSNNSGPTLSIHSGGSIGFCSETYLGTEIDVVLRRDAANTLAQRNGTNAQTKRLYGTYTDASNYRRVAIAMTTAGVASITPEGAGTGASGNVLHISGLPTSNPGAGILWNDSGTVKVGT